MSNKDINKDLSIGALAKLVNVNIETIRYYQRRGLLGVPQKEFRGQRRYTQEYAASIHFIKRAQAHGFTLQEIGQLINFKMGKDCSTVNSMLQQRIEETASQITKLTEMQKMLCGFIQNCNAVGCTNQCHVISKLQV